ncbi:MAG: hypothetical protein F6K31_18695 [Symploca sp. SIO2G7]|nr:hypothetical protein [Symploca sp. SIO2G7]
MDFSELLKHRIKQKGTSKYAIAKALAEAEGKGRGPTTFNTRVGKVINDPKGRIFRNLEEIVRLLDGEIVIRWKDEKVVRSRTEFTEEVIE